MSLKLAIAKVLRDIRVERGMSLTELAKETELSKGNLSRLESGGAGLTLNTIEKICGVLDVDISEVFVEADKLMKHKQKGK